MIQFGEKEDENATILTGELATLSALVAKVNFVGQRRDHIWAGMERFVDAEKCEFRSPFKYCKTRKSKNKITLLNHHIRSGL